MRNETKGTRVKTNGGISPLTANRAGDVDDVVDWVCLMMMMMMMLMAAVSLLLWSLVVENSVHVENMYDSSNRSTHHRNYVEERVRNWRMSADLRRSVPRAFLRWKT